MIKLFNLKFDLLRTVFIRTGEAMLKELLLLVRNELTVVHSSRLLFLSPKALR